MKCKPVESRPLRPKLPRVAFDFDPYQAVLLDLDGTIYHEEHPLPGAVDLIRRLQREGRKYACLTNSTSSPARISDRLKRMGVDVDPAHIYTAAAAACDYVMERFAAQSVGEGANVGGPEGGKTKDNNEPDRADSPSSDRPIVRPLVFNLSTEGVDEMLEGKVVWVNDETERCDAVICGVPLNVFATFERQRTALVLLRNGAELVGICADRIYPSPRGLEFGVGAVAMMLGYAATVKPTFCGKPEPLFFRELCQRLDADPTQCILLGDNLESDIAGAKSVGMKTMLLLTGITRSEDLPSIPDRLRPDLVVESLVGL